MLNLSSLRFERAGQAEIQAICDLVNLTYRGKFGWTTEVAIIQGDRTNYQEIEAALSKPDANFLVVQQQNRLVACIYVAKEDIHAFIGFFSVHPDWQGKGLGKYLLAQAEIHAREIFGINKLLMFVISQRTELISFYQRRGYQLTGQTEICPHGLGKPKVAGLTIDYLEKTI